MAAAASVAAGYVVETSLGLATAIRRKQQFARAAILPPGMTELDREGRSPLHYAVGPEVDPKRVERLIEDGADVALPDRQGWTPLHFAAASNQAECAELLLRAGAPVDAVDMHGNTPLWRAVFAYAGDGATIAALRAAGADPHRANAHDVSPLELARRIGSSDVADVFVDADR